MTFQEKLGKINDWLSGPDGKALWDVMTAARGPDSPSERADGRDSGNYPLRVARKMKTVAVIRGRAFPNASGARIRHADSVTLPADRGSWDHFDKHVERAAKALGLEVRLEG